MRWFFQACRLSVTVLAVHAMAWLGSSSIAVAQAGPSGEERTNGNPSDTLEKQFLEQRSFEGAEIPPDAYDRASDDWTRFARIGGSLTLPVGPPTQNGDLNGDARIDLSDVIYLLNHLYNGGASPAPGRCGKDPSGDGRLDLDDALFLLSHLFSGGPAPESCPAISRLGGGGAVTGIQGTVWTAIGPSPILQSGSNVNGRVSAIAINPNNPSLIYLGASGGGVWRTTDAGAAWTPLYDQQVSLGVGEPSSIAIDPSNTNTLYVGTSGRFVLNISKGILKSTDGGGSWIVLGDGFPAGNDGNADTLFAGQSINAIIVDPAASNTVYLGASNGLFVSTNGGRNFTPGTNGGGDAQSLALDATSAPGSRILYAGISGRGVFQSTNGGGSWTSILNSGTAVLSTALAGGTFGHVVVALAPPASPANPAGIQVLYATMTGGGTAPDPVGVFQSTDQGANWTQRGAAGLGTNTQGGYDLVLDVDPASPGDGAADILYYAAIGQFKSTDAGANFSGISNGQHVDNHAQFAFVLQPSPTPSIVYSGNDGGVFRSTDGGATWSGTGGAAPPTINAGGLQTALFYNLDVKNDAGATVTEGTLQDNGTVRKNAGLDWTDTQGGDGWDIAFDSGNLNDAYNSSGFWSPAPCTRVWKSTDSGASFPSDITPWGTTTDQGCYLAPVNADPNTAGTVYVSGSQNLWQSQDGGGSWRIISNTGGAGQCKVARGNSNNVVFSLGNQVSVSTNALAATVGPPTGVTFTNITRNLPNRSVTRVAFDPNDPTVIYATLSGFNTQTPGQPGHVFRTTISGTAWTDISPSLDVSFNALVLDGAPAPSAIYVGTDLGVMRTVDQGTTWTVMDDAHFPNVPVTDLVINPQAGVLRASTFGRGAFELADATSPVIAINAENGLQFGGVCRGTSGRLTIQVFNVGNKNLVVNSVQRLMGSSDFTVLPNPSTPLVISPDAEVDFTVEYTPTTAGPALARIRIASNDPGAPVFDLMASGSGTDEKVATIVADAGSFGDVCVGSFKDLDVTLNNSGACDLTVTNITSSSSQFRTSSTLSYPLLVHPGDSMHVPIRFEPTSIGAKTGTISVSTSDPVTPVKAVSVSGNAPSGDVRVTGSTEFGDVCAGELAEKTLSVCNVGGCNLHVTSVAFEPPCADFALINNPFPATVSPDSCLDVVIRFTPTSAGPKSCTLVVRTDDPDQPVISLTVRANTPAAAIDVPPDQAFPPTVVQSLGACHSEADFPISNVGTCNLTITNVVISANPGEFSLLGLPSFPIILETGHIAGEGDLRLSFGPRDIGRSRMGEVRVTYVSDPITGATTVVTRKLCGEGVKTGARVLVTAGGVPVANVEKLQLHRINANRNRDAADLDSVDLVMNVAPQTVVPAAPCPSFKFHREYGTVSNSVQLLPGVYQVTVVAVVGGKRETKIVGFSIDSCDFNANINVEY